MSFSWFLPPGADFTFATQVTDCLSAINTLFSTNSGNTLAYWEVATFNVASPRYIILKRKNGAAGRIIIFGQSGSTPAAAACRVTAASVLFIGYSKTSASNTADASYLTTAPLSASDYMPGVQMFAHTAVALHRMAYIEHPDGIYIADTTIVTTPGLSIASAGENMVDLSGTVLSCIQGSGSTAATIGWATQLTATASIFPGSPAADNSYATTQAAVVIRTGGANRLVYRALAFSATTTGGNTSQYIYKLQDFSRTRAHFFPIWFVFNTTSTDCIAGKLMQVAFGPGSTSESRWIDNNASPASEAAFCLSHDMTWTTSTAAQAVWFTNFDL